MAELIFFKGVVSSIDTLILQKKKNMTSVKLTEKPVISTLKLKWPSTGFWEQNYQLRKKKKTCQRVGSGLLNHRSLRILKHLPKEEPKLLLEEFNLTEWRKNYGRSLLCRAMIHLDLLKLSPKQQLVLLCRSLGGWRGLSLSSGCSICSPLVNSGLKNPQ